MLVVNSKIVDKCFRFLNNEYNRIFDYPNKSSSIKADKLFEIRKSIMELCLKFGKDQNDLSGQFKDIHIDNVVIVFDDIKILPGTVIDGPCIVGANVRLGPSAYIHGPSIISSGSRVGHCCEIKSSILLTKVKSYHYSFIGDSIIGHNTNIGAGSIFSVKRLDSKPIKFQKCHIDKHDFTAAKYGALVGNDVQFGVGCKIMPGAVVSSNCLIKPCSIVKGYYDGQ